MPVDRLPNLPRGADVFLDANIFIYAFAAQSTDCRYLLRRCAREEVYGITTLEVINEVTHRLMLSEAVASGVITRASAVALRGKWREVVKLTQYWAQTVRIFGLNILVLASDESRLHEMQCHA